ncbi:MAG: GNAT family N-acetyltransferase [Planctomycetes bacterium]|nr:GNAT family N-acetyltransferase [Planctomycetota bacterium]
MELHEHVDAADFLAAAEGHLRAHETINSLPYGLALRVRDEQHPKDAGTRFFSLRAGGEIVATALQTPGFPVLFPHAEPAAVRALAAALPERVERLVGCNGEVALSDAAAETWRERGHGAPHAHMELRLYELTDLAPPRPAPGRMRRADAGDLDLVRRWTLRFQIDCKFPGVDPTKLPEHVPPLDAGRLYLWEVDGEPVSCAAWQRPVGSGACVSYVYTPDELRGRGYASNIVAGVTQGLLEGRLDFAPRRYVTLFTDLANPTSNAIYQRLGYRPVADFRHYVLR